MSTLTDHPAYALVEDLLDAVGQRYRGYLLVRGAILFVTFAAATLVAAALLASFLGPGWLTRGIAILTLLANAVAFLIWIGKPLILRPRALAVARMVEQRIPGTHNGLTNMLLLARADDLGANPWMDEIFREIASEVSQRPLSQAIEFSELRRPAIISASIVVPLLLIGLLFSPRLLHGAAQMVRPTEFVPLQGAVEIVEVIPGDATVIKGRSLEITAIAAGPGEFSAQVIFEDQPQPAAMQATVDAEGRRRFTFVRNHIDESTRYRIDAGGTQSRWYEVTAIRQVSLESVTVNITPPAYTRAQPQTMQVAASELGKTPVIAPQGSIVKLAFDIDIPVTSGMLQIGENGSQPMAAISQMDGKRFSAELPLRDATPVSLLLIDSTGQIIARVPEQPLLLQCTIDQAPGVEMRWPQFDASVAPTQELQVEARLRDDYGLSSARLLWSASEDEPMQIAAERNYSNRPTAEEFSAKLTIPQDVARHGNSIWVQVEASDNRDLLSLASDMGMQTTRGRRVEIRFRDPQELAREQEKRIGKLQEALQGMLERQKKLRADTQAISGPKIDNSKLPPIHAGQSDLRAQMLHVAETFTFEASDRIIQKTLQVLAGGTAREAIDYARAAISEQEPTALATLLTELDARQRRIILTLEDLLAILNTQAKLNDPAAQKRAGDIDSPAEQYRKLDEALKKFIEEEQRILNQTAGLAKKPVDNFDEADKKLLEELQQAQEKMDAFMKDTISDFSNLAEQDMANASLLRELLEVYAEVTMAKGALREQMVELAISHEEMALELAKEINSNLEKWLLEKPDRFKWTQEDQLERAEPPMAELPIELEDMIGELMEEQEDLFEDIEDANANWHDSLDIGAGWDAMDGPIDNMSAKGVTGNTLPNDNEMGGRSGEGRSGRSQGEMVEETATGKGGRNTPTRLDPTAFQQGQIKDTSNDPVGGATGGGKLSGQGGAGLEGPTAPEIKQQMERLKQRQAELRNTAERLNLQYQLGSYDNFKLLEAVAIMRRLESDLSANRYQNALRRRDILLDTLDRSRTLIGGEISVQHDTTPTGNRKIQREINDAINGPLPPAWENALKQYYRKLGQE